MPINGKIFMTVALIVLLIAFALIKPNANNAGSELLWRGGKKDPIRNLLMREDGSLRRFTKASIALFFGAALVILWLAVPTR